MEYVLFAHRGGVMQKQANISPIEESPLLRFDRRRVESEISLVDLWLIVRRRWSWLLAGLAVGVSVAVAYIAFTVPIYESHMTLRMGNVPTLGLIEDTGVLSVELINMYGPITAGGTRSQKPYLEKKDIKAKNNLLELVAVGYSPEEARDLLAQVAAKILQRHEQAYGNVIDPLRRRLATMDGQVSLLTKQIVDLGELVARMKESNPVQASLVAIERSRLFTSLDQLERDRVSLQQQVTQPYTNPSQVIVQPELQNSPVSPRKVLAAVTGIVLGIFIGLVAIFLRQFFAQVSAAKG
ncbi:MAG: hypothetical protein A2W18_05625 [Candidatus Muproteobacteria bacterium RBG_16_60_9]|uniref:Polysaccharide chain length determinant N-terminal domain-containing protein n=1 Tax=Candidatus Muproteobacteria bacterium RBG_16_60_9 TaxID=1817755 RepID=A0A1F6V6A0_9PROT|nr:MAG: hypothetical protein A2W18_05625 [Candidatus Muproteobacteria bacterium RBG_16_60_9]